MPYIEYEARCRLNDLEAVIESTRLKNPGELNYAFTLIASEYLKNNGLNYQHINDIVGALEGCKLELYRRVASWYEDEKLENNGDVFHPDQTSRYLK